MPVLVHAPIVESWAARKLGRSFVPPAASIGWLDRRGFLSSAALFHDYYENGNIDICLIADGRLARGFLQACAEYVFRQLKCSRVTARPYKSNASACEQLVRAGFKLEAELPAYYGKDDAVQFRMMRNECRWLKHERAQGS